MNIGQYRILEKLGTGGMGTVYLGEHILLGRSAAIKILKPALSAHREVVERFFNEARATSAISDPGVVQVFDFGYHVDGTAYIVMELLEGEPLATRIHRLGKLHVHDALRIVRQVAGSLAAAHARNIVHRDLKPANIFLVRDPQAQGGERTKLLDFGICKLEIDGDPRLTGSDAVLGTPVYMSPEQCRNARLADQRSDVYALGGVLFHMLTGRPPFEGESAGDFIAAHLTEDAPAVGRFADVPPAVDALVLRCLAKSPEDRFQSMAELQAAIDEVLAAIPERISIEAAIPLHLVHDREAVPVPVPRESSMDPQQQSWFVSATPLPTTLEPNHPERSRGGLARIVLAGVVVALAAVFVASLRDDDGERFSEIVDRARSSVVARTVEPAAVEPAAVEPTAAPAPTIADWEPGRLADGLAQTMATPILAKPSEPIAEPKQAAKPRPAITRPAITRRPVIQQPPRPAPAPPPAPISKPSEDLYDTR